MSKELAASGQLSAEQIKEAARELFTHYGWNNEHDNHMRRSIEVMRDMALSSLRGTFADGIEAAVKAVYAIRNRRFDDAVYQEAWWDACDIAEGKIRALAQGQRTSEQDADELLREVLDWGLPDDLKQRIDAYLSRK